MGSGVIGLSFPQPSQKHLKVPGPRSVVPYRRHIRDQLKLIKHSAARNMKKA